MKRSVLWLIPLVMSLASCGNASSIPNQKTVNKLKELLSKQDLSEFHSKTYKGTFIQDYDVLDIYTNEEDEKVSSYFNYSGRGILGTYYNLNADQYNSIVDEKGDIDTFDAISEGEGYYGIVQTVRTMSFTREDGLESETHNLDIAQQMILKSTNQDLWLYNTLDVTDKGVFDGDLTQRFNASIDKELFFGSVSTRSFREIISKVNLFDAPGNIEHLDKLYYSTCRDLVSKSDKEISNFVRANQISIKEEDNIELSFVFTNEDIEEVEMDYIFPGAIKGTLFFDKNTYQFSDFKYEMIYKIEAFDEDTGDIKVIDTKFYCEGVSYRGLPDDPWEPIDPTVYDDVAEFLTDVNEQVVPPAINL